METLVDVADRIDCSFEEDWCGYSNESESVLINWKQLSSQQLNSYFKFTGSSLDSDIPASTCKVVAHDKLKFFKRFWDFPFRCVSGE